MSAFGDVLSQDKSEVCEKEESYWDSLEPEETRYNSSIYIARKRAMRALQMMRENGLTAEQASAKLDRHPRWLTTYIYWIRKRNPNDHLVRELADHYKIDQIAVLLEEALDLSEKRGYSFEYIARLKRKPPSWVSNAFRYDVKGREHLKERYKRIIASRKK